MKTMQASKSSQRYDLRSFRKRGSNKKIKIGATVETSINCMFASIHKSSLFYMGAFHNQMSILSEIISRLIHVQQPLRLAWP